MNTFCEVSAEGEEGIYLEEIVEEIFLELKRIENIFSRYMCGSEIYKLNQNAIHSPIKVDNEVFQLIARSLEFSKLTHGAFDISVAQAVEFWRLAEDKNTLPAENEIKELKAKIGYQNIVIDSAERSIYFSRPEMQVDVGALAKGYGLDKAATLIKAKGIGGVQINLGGNIYVLDGRPHIIGIRNPLFPDEIATTVSLRNGSISTSANYERFFTIGNKRFGHLLNPLTGCPAESDILSASVIGEDAALADALSTALFVLGFKKAKALLKDFQGVEAVIICKPKFGSGLKIFRLKGGSER